MDLYMKYFIYQKWFILSCNHLLSIKTCKECFKVCVRQPCNGSSTKQYEVSTTPNALALPYCSSSIFEHCHTSSLFCMGIRKERYHLLKHLLSRALPYSQDTCRSTWCQASYLDHIVLRSYYRVGIWEFQI